MSEQRKAGFNTRAIHTGESPDPATGAHGTPIYQNTTFALGTWQRFEDFWAGEDGVFGYSRDHNPTVYRLEQKVADLEGAAGSVGLASGMAAISTVLLTFAAGGHVVCADQVYNTANKLIEQELPGLGMSFSRVDITDLSAVEAAIQADTKAIYTECFSNPGLIVADLDALAEMAHRHGILLIVDNTFLSPALLRPLERGADIVIHSATKYLAGHGEVLGGVVSANAERVADVRRTGNRFGGTLSAMSAWMILTGIRTLPLRIERHCQNAIAVAEMLAEHPAVASIHYPGLPRDPGHATATRLLGDGPGFGGMMSITLHGGPDAIATFAESVRVFTFATSLGDTSSLVWPIFGSDVIRLSVGLENIEDLLADLEQALGRVG